MAATPIGSCAHAWINQRRRLAQITAETADRQRYALNRFATMMGQRRPENVGRSDIERWLEAIIVGRSPGTVRYHFVTVRSFYAHLVNLDSSPVRRSPFRDIPAPKVPKSRHRSLKPSQVAAILAACRDELDLACLLIGFQCGLRRAEIAGIQVGDINWESVPQPTVTVTGKGQKVRTVSLPDEAVEAINRYLKVHPANGGPLFRQRLYPNRGITPPWLGEQFVKIAYEAGVKDAPRDGVSMHAARHTALTDIYRACLDVRAVQQIAGHDSLKTTQGYIEGIDAAGMAKAMAGRTYLTGLAQAV